LRLRLTAREATRAVAFFEEVAIAGFYDGPETGIGWTSERAAYRFYAIGESRSRRYRAYLVDHLVGVVPFTTGGRADAFVTAAEWTRRGTFRAPTGTS
jgi:hypothetical protein